MLYLIATDKETDNFDWLKYIQEYTYYIMLCPVITGKVLSLHFTWNFCFIFLCIFICAYPVVCIFVQP